MCSIDEFITLLAVKNVLVNCYYSELQQVCEDKEAFVIFLDGINKLLDIECPFFFLDEYANDSRITTMIVELLNEYRFIYHSSYFSNEINTIFSKINNLKSCDLYQKKLRLNQYIIFQEESRKKNYRGDYLDIIEDLGFDYMIIEALKEKDTQELLQFKDLFLSSTNYLINNFSDLYIVDDNYSNNLSWVNSIIHEKPFYKNLILKQKAIQTKRSLQKLKK